MMKHTILWADDDEDDLFLFREVLQEITGEYDVLTFPDGRALLDHLKMLSVEQYPCLIILDMNMPVLTGRETLAILKSEPELQNIPVVVFTTSNSEMDRSFCARFDTAMITKPPTYATLKSMVPRLLSFCGNRR